MGFLTNMVRGGVSGVSSISQKITGTVKPTVGYGKPAPQNPSKVASLFDMASVGGRKGNGGKPKL